MTEKQIIKAFKDFKEAKRILDEVKVFLETHADLYANVIKVSTRKTRFFPEAVVKSVSSILTKQGYTSDIFLELKSPAKIEKCVDNDVFEKIQDLIGTRESKSFSLKK